MACDICGKSEVYLENIRDYYQTDNIRYVCESCRDEINEKIDEIKANTFEINKCIY